MLRKAECGTPGTGAVGSMTLMLRESQEGDPVKHRGCMCLQEHGCSSSLQEGILYRRNSKHFPVIKVYFAYKRLISQVELRKHRCIMQI